MEIQKLFINIAFMKITAIAVMSNNGAIGKNGNLLWNLPKDLKRFKAITTGHHVLMGRKTFESIGKALPNRTNLVVSRTHHFESYFPDIESAIAYAKSNGETELFVIGGAEIYAQTCHLWTDIYLTLVHRHKEGDTFFPQIPHGEWEIVSKRFEFDGENENIPCTFIELKRV